MGTKTNRKHRIIKDLLTKQNGQCWYCKIPCRIRYSTKKGEKFPYPIATIEHLYTKEDLRRLIYSERSQPIVMACARCNKKKGSTFHRQVTGEDAIYDPVDLIRILNNKL